MKATERKGTSSEDLEWLRSMKRQVQIDMHGLLNGPAGGVAAAGSARDAARTGTEDARSDQDAAENGNVHCKHHDWQQHGVLSDDGEASMDHELGN